MDKTKKSLINTIFFFLMLTSFALAEQQQTTNTISLSPYYLPSLTANTNYTFNLNVNPVDDYTQTISAIIKLQNYMTPAITYNLWINNQTCNPVAHTISTTYSNSQQAEISFDCSNVINHKGNYTIKIQTNKNTGSITGWLDFTYINNAQGKVAVHGTEYISGNPAKVWLQLINSTGQSVTNGVCYIDIYTPTNQEFIERAQMSNLNHDGIYYYDLIAPQIQGVFPVIATCYYIATEYDFNATTYFINNGTYSSGAITNTYIQDGIFLRLKEANYGGIRRIQAGLNFTNVTYCAGISESLLTGFSINTYMKFDSVTNDDLTISIYNYTSNTWQNLTNKHLESNAFSSTSNTITTNNLTKSGLYNSTRGVQIRFEDTNLSDGADSNLDIDVAELECDLLGSPQWIEVKGSSEIHINSGTEGYNFEVNTLCDQNDLSNGCAEFYTNITRLNEPQGLIRENITITNLAYIPITDHIYYQTGSTIDCSAIQAIYQKKGTTITDITNDTYYTAGTGLDNCQIQIPVELNVTETSYTIEIIMENYALWEIQRANDIIQVMNESSSAYCYDLNYTYIVPINQTLNSTGFELFCNRILDDLYWYDTLVRTEAPTVTTIGEIDQYIIEERFYYPEIVEAYLFIEAQKRNENQQNILNLTTSIYQLISNLSLNVSFNETQNLINIQTNLILQAINNATNLTTLEINLLNQSINNQLTTLSAQINANTTTTQNLINSQVNSILNTLDYYHNLTKNEINSLNQTITNQYNNLLANQNTIISINQQINATTLANQIALQNILNELNQTKNQIQYINITLQNVTNITMTNQNWLTTIWNYITQNLFNLSTQINTTTTQNQQLLQLLLNQTNTTLIPVTIQYNQSSCITGSNWQIQNIVLNQNQQLMTYPDVTCEINTTLWGNNNMTYQYPYFTYTNTCPPTQNWNWTITCV